MSSERSRATGATTFVLGIEGLSQELKRAHHDSAGHLMFVGTWHSHPMGGGHSGLDRATLAKIADLGKGLPMLSLVWTPNGLICEVEHVFIHSDLPSFDRSLYAWCLCPSLCGQ